MGHLLLVTQIEIEIEIGIGSEIIRFGLRL